MSMNGDDLVDELGGRTEGEFTEAQCLIALNSALDTVLGLADPELLRNLITTSSGLVLAGSPPSLSLSTLNAVDNRFLSFTQVATPFMEYEIIDKQEANRLRRSSFLTPDRTNPKAYLIGETFTSICSDDTTGGVNVEYIEKPADIANSSTVVDLNPSLKEPLMLFGEAFLWRTDDELERSTDAYNKAMAYMQVVNGKDMKYVGEEVQKKQASKL